MLAGHQHTESFVYAPASGDRVLIEVVSDYVKVVRQDNGCRHAIGGTHLWWYADGVENHWRYEAARLATAIVRAVGGLAWDAEGNVHLVVPVHVAFAAYGLMYAERGKHMTSFAIDRVERFELVTSLVVSGAAQFVAGKFPEIEARWVDIAGSRIEGMPAFKRETLPVWLRDRIGI